MDKKWSSPKEYLFRAIKADHEINLNIELIDSLWTKVTGVNKKLKLDLVQESGSWNRTGTIDNIIELQEETNKMIDDLIDLRNELLSEINQLDNQMYCLVLTHRYILNKKLPIVGDDLGYSYSHIRKLHGWALQEFKKKFPEKFKRTS